MVSLAFYLGMISNIILRLPLTIPSGFLIFEFPTVYIAQKLRAAKYLGGNIILWGIILMLHATTTSFGGFFALRFLLGEYLDYSLYRALNVV